MTAAPVLSAAVHQVHFDGRIVNMNDAVDAPGHRVAHAVLLGIVDLVLFERRANRAGNRGIDDAALQNRLRSVRSGGLRPGLGHAHRFGNRGERGMRGRGVLRPGDCRKQRQRGDGPMHFQTISPPREFTRTSWWTCPRCRPLRSWSDSASTCLLQRECSQSPWLWCRNRSSARKDSCCGSL